MTNNTIRPVEAGEREIWNELFQGYADFYKVTIDDTTKDAVWEWIFDADNDFWCDVIEGADGEVIGFTQYQLMHRSLGGGMVCYLSDLFVKPEIRGSGAGRALIDHVFEFARGRGLNNVRWLTQDFNFPARMLYDTYGRKSDFILYSFNID